MESYEICRARALRQRCGITVQELACAAGVSSQLISKIELEPERQTPAHERLLRNAFFTLIQCRRIQQRALEQELNSGGSLFQTEEGGEHHGI